MSAAVIDCHCRWTPVRIVTCTCMYNNILITCIMFWGDAQRALNTRRQSTCCFRGNAQWTYDDCVWCLTCRRHWAEAERLQHEQQSTQRHQLSSAVLHLAERRAPWRWVLASFSIHTYTCTNGLIAYSAQTMLLRTYVVMFSSLSDCSSEFVYNCTGFSQGSCVWHDQRCDSSFDCDDRSDEDDCSELTARLYTYRQLKLMM